MDITEIPAIDDQARDALRENGVRTTQQLLEQAATPADRMRLADVTNLSDETLTRWVYLSDLLRVDGVTVELAESLCAIGVSTVPKLAYKTAEQLAVELAADDDTGQNPSEIELERIIARAKQLPKMIRH